MSLEKFVKNRFYEELKVQLKPSDSKLTDLHQETIQRLESMSGAGFIDQIDYQYSVFNNDGGLLYAIGFIEADHSLLVHAWKD